MFNSGWGSDLPQWKCTCWLPDERKTAMKTAKAVFGIVSITTALVIQVRAQSFLTNGLVAYYPFNGNANDASGNGNNGTIVGATLTANRFGDPNSAYFLNGSTGYILIPNAPANNVAAQFTISFWMNAKPGYGTPADNGIQIISKWGNGGVGLASYQIGITPAGRLYTATYDGNNEALLNDPSVTSIGVWHQVVFVRNSNGFYLYRDNALLCWTNSMPQPQHSTLNLNFGREETGNYAYYGGGLDDIRIYNRALSTNEVQQLYAYESQPIVSFKKAVKPSFSNLYLGTNYQLQVSTDLNTWTNNGAPFTPTNTIMDYHQYFDVDDWGQLFFRLKVSP